MFSTLKKLKKAGILGINSRNIDYVLKYNPRKLYPLADNKIRTKELASEAGIEVPDLYGTISSVGELKSLRSIVADKNDFVIKPCRGCGGEGITVITEIQDDGYLDISGKFISRRDLQHHVANILHGLFSLGSRPDQAMIEYRVRFDQVFAEVSYKGVPDIRIVTLKGVPVMAILRLPTKISGGKANLHQGAIGVGIDLAKGKTLNGVWFNQTVSDHPDTGKAIMDRIIPHWETLLTLASKSYGLTGLGYQGVDIVLDRDRGPLLLEVNTRPGLNLQIANQTGLTLRLKKIEEALPQLISIEEKVAFAKENFSHIG